MSTDLKSAPKCALPTDTSLIVRVRKYIMNIVNVMYAILVDPLSTYSVHDMEYVIVYNRTVRRAFNVDFCDLQGS